MSVNFVAKNASNFVKLNAAFFIVEIETGLTRKQLNSLLDKIKYSNEVELITIEGEEGTAMGLMDMRWFEQKFKYDPVKIERFVQKVIDGVYEESDDDVYFLEEGPIFIGIPNVY